MNRRLLLAILVYAGMGLFVLIRLLESCFEMYVVIKTRSSLEGVTWV